MYNIILYVIQCVGPEILDIPNDVGNKAFIHSCGASFIIICFSDSNNAFKSTNLPSNIIKFTIVRTNWFITI